MKVINIMGVSFLEEIYNKVHQVIMDVWRYDIKDDYESFLLLKEDTLKNAMYHHIRTRLGDAFIKENNLAIFTEFYTVATKQKIDLVVVRLNSNKENEYLGDDVEEVIAIVEIKYKAGNVKNNVFVADVHKIINYMDLFDSSATKFFLAFIREKCLSSEEETSFLASYNEIPKNKVVEMLSYWTTNDNEEISSVWKIIKH